MSVHTLCVTQIKFMCDRCRRPGVGRMSKDLNEKAGSITIKTEGFVQVSQAVQELFAMDEIIICRECAETTVPNEEDHRGGIEVAGG